MGTRVMNELPPKPSSYRDTVDLYLDVDILRRRRDLKLDHDADFSQRLKSAELHTPSSPTSPTDQLQRVAGLSIGFCSIFAEQILSHPCLVLRRQCQVHHAGGWYHLTPFSLVRSMIKIQRNQGGLVLWKGLGGVYMVKAITMLSESVLSEVTPFPREVSRHSTLKKYGGHLVLKGTVFAAATSFFAASLIECVQSDIASERPGIFSILFEGAFRLGSWVVPQTSRQLPVWQLALPTIVFRLTHYVVSSIAQFTVTSAMHLEQQEIRSQPGGSGRAPSAYEMYFPQLLASFTGGLLADVLTFPLETVLHRLYVQGTRTIIDDTDLGEGVTPIITGYDGFIDCFRCILMQEGIPGLYRGFGALVLQYSIHAIILRVAKFMFEKLSKEVSRRQALERTAAGGATDVRTKP